MTSFTRYVIGLFLTFPLAFALWLLFGLLAPIFGWNVWSSGIHGVMALALPISWLVAAVLLIGVNFFLRFAKRRAAPASTTADPSRWNKR